MVASSPVIAPAPAVAPAPLRYPLHALLGKPEQEDLDYLKALLGHAVPSGDLTKVLGRVFQAAIRELEREKFAVTSRSRAGRGGQCTNPRYVPDPVRRAVFKRDGGRCTYVSAKGHRCASQNRLEFDHVIPVAKGGESTVPNLRLRCRTHNQHAAEKAFGAGFMARKRAESRTKSIAKAGAGAHAMASLQSASAARDGEGSASRGGQGGRMPPPDGEVIACAPAPAAPRRRPRVGGAPAKRPAVRSSAPPSSPRPASP